MKILERIVDSLIQQVVSIDDTSRALSQEEHYRCILYGLVNAGEMPHSDQIDFYGLPGHREAINSVPPWKIYLLRAEKAISPRQ